MANPPQCLGDFAPITWLVQGSYFEDEQTYGALSVLLRPTDHFYTVEPDRVPGRVIGLTDASEPFFMGYILIPDGITNSFAWASQIGIQGPLSQQTRRDETGESSVVLAQVGTNLYNWPFSRQYEFAALTNSIHAARNKNLALMLYSLGHVLHLNQDLSQPDHVRNDNHFSKAWIEDFGLRNYTHNAQWFSLPPNATTGWTNWQAQGFTNLLSYWDRGLFINGNAGGLIDDAAGTVGRKLGLAEFSNGNFLGEDAIYAEYFDSSDLHYFPYPSLQTGTTFPAIRPHLTTGGRTLYLKNGTPIRRIYLDKTGDGIAFSNHSVLNYLGAYFPGRDWSHGIAEVASTINDGNVLQSYHSRLIPKAVEYSTGILDYFFRGTLGVGFNESFGIAITNTSTQDFRGGAFHLFCDDPNGIRTEVTGAGFSPNYPGTLLAGQKITASFNPPSDTANCVVVFQGSIGNTDPVDSNIAIAAKKFLPFSWWKMEEYGEDDRVDVIEGSHLEPLDFFDTGAIAAVSGKIGSAIQLTLTANSVEFGSDVDVSQWPGTPVTDSGATWCGWWKHSGTFDPNTDFYMTFKDGDAICYLSQSLDGGNLVMTTTSGYKTGTAVPLPSKDAWHLFLIEVDAAGTWQLQFDDTGSVYTASSKPPGTGHTAWFDVDADAFHNGADGPPTESFIETIDEVGLFPTLLSQTQKEYLYNSGSGRTWPFSLP
jgi:hypothetical protein